MPRHHARTRRLFLVADGLEPGPVSAIGPAYLGGKYAPSRSSATRTNRHRERAGSGDRPRPDRHTGTGLRKWKPECDDKPLDCINTGHTEKGIAVPRCRLAARGLMCNDVAK